MSKPGKVLKELCKKLGVRLTVKRGKREFTNPLLFLKDNALIKRKDVLENMEKLYFQN